MTEKKQGLAGRLLSGVKGFFNKRAERAHRDLFAWHSKTFYPFDKKLTQLELTYLDHCFRMATFFDDVYEGTGEENYSYYTYSHRVKGDKVNSSRFAYGSLAQPHEALVPALDVIKERGVEVESVFLEDPNSLFYGLGWDFEANHFKVYFRILDFAKMERPSLRSLLNEAKTLEYDLVDEGLICFTFIEQELYEEKVYAYPRPTGDEIFPGTIGQALMSTSKRGIVMQYDVSSNKIWSDKMNETGKQIVKTYNQQGYTLDTLAMQDSENFTLYFPGIFQPFIKYMS